MSKHREIAELSYVEAKRDGVMTGEKTFVVIPDGEAALNDSSTEPKCGDAYSTTYPNCLLTSAKFSQYKGSQKTAVTCFYTSEEMFESRLNVPVPMTRIVTNGEVLSLSKTLGLTWASDSAAVDQYVQLLIPGAQVEAYECYETWLEAYSFMLGRIGKVSPTNDRWLCVSATPTYGVSFRKLDTIPTATPKSHIRVKYSLAFKGASINGWQALFRESTMAWEETDSGIYEYCDNRYDFLNLVPFV